MTGAEPFSDRIVTATLQGRTTGVDGRFILDGPNFQLVTDGSVATGGPGKAPGSLDLLIAALVTCGLNVLRGGDVDDAGGPVRDVEIFARVEREDDSADVGLLVLEVFVADVDTEAAEALVEDYRLNCRVYDAVRSILPVVIIPHGDRAGHERS